MERIEKPESEWKEELSPERFRVLRRAGTERAGTGALLHEHADGTYRCGACGLALFDSDAKFDSGTGWPSFSSARPGSVELKRDFKLLLRRTEARCARCGSHLGHVFKDGPRPTGQRFCMNSVALDFTRAGGS